MATTSRLSTLLFALLLLGVAPASAQQRSPDRRPARTSLSTEKNMIETMLSTIVGVLQEATLQNPGNVGDHLQQMAHDLRDATTSLSPEHATAGDATITETDLERLYALLQEASDQLQHLRQDLQNQEEYATANRLVPIEQNMRDATSMVDRFRHGEVDPSEVVTLADGDRWLRSDRDDETSLDDADRQTSVRIVLSTNRMRRSIDEALGAVHDARQERDREDAATVWDRRDGRYHRRHGTPFDRPSYVTSHVGTLSFDWPFRETAVYRPIPAIRYNRVEGLVLGFGLPPLGWFDYDRGRVFGQLGYAFALDSWRYEVGVETRPGRDPYYSDYGLKVGGSYHRNTATDDLWKSSWAENSLGAFFFESDFFDYYETEGWTIYAVQYLTSNLQLSAGFRDDEYRSLARNTGWSLFDGGGFRENPAIDPGRMSSLVFAVEGGHVRHLDRLPRGTAFRLEAEVGQGLGGDFSFNRYLGDVRLYLPAGRYSSLSLRLRGGIGEGDALPFQKEFSVGGIGSVRAYPQNVFRGTRMLLGNVEYTFDDVSLFDHILDDVQVFGFADAGWVNTPLTADTQPTNAFRLDDVIPAAGLGIGLDDRSVRIELAWPLRDLGFGMQPSLWLRLNPTF